MVLKLLSDMLQAVSGIIGNLRFRIVSPPGWRLLSLPPHYTRLSLISSLSMFRGLMWELQTLLPKSAHSLSSGQTLVLVIDGVDQLGEQSGQLILDWIPKTLPQKVHLVMSMSANTGLWNMLQHHQDVHVVALKPLEPIAQAQLVRQELALYGKHLKETPTHNQMGLLLAKEGAGLPLYLRLATDHLRLFTFEQVQSGNQTLLASLLTNLNVMAAYLELGLLSQLMEAHTLYASSVPVDELAPAESNVAKFYTFLKQQSKLLTQYPALLAQQATNQPSDSPVCCQVSKLAQRWSSQPILHWLNKPQTMGAQQSCKLSLNSPSPPTAVGFTPNGQRAIVATANGIVHLLDTCTWQEEKSIVSDCVGISSCLCPSNTTLFLATLDGLLELWDLQGGWRVFQTKAHQLQITDCCLSPDCQLLATVSLDRHLKLWEIVHGKLAAQHLSQKSLNCVAFHPEGQVIITGNWAGRLSVLRPDNLTVIMELGGPGSSVRAVTFAPSGSTLTASHLDGMVVLWAWPKGVQLAAFPAHQGYVASALYLRSGHQLLTAGEDGKVQVWSGFLGQPKGTLGSLSLSPALSVAISPDRVYVAVGHQTDGIKIYSISSGTKEHQCLMSNVAVSALAWLSHRILVSGGEDGKLRCWVLKDETPCCLWVLPAHQKAVLALATSRELFASASEDCTVKLWSLPFPTQPEMKEEFYANRKPIEHGGPVTCCSFNFNGKYLATGSKDKRLLCWRVTRPEYPFLLTFFPHQDWITGCSWTKNDILLSCSNDGSVRLWDPVIGNQLVQFLGHQSAVSTVVAVEEHVVSVDRDGMLKVWDLRGVEMTSIPAHSGPISHCVATQELQTAGQPGSELLVITVGLDGATRLWHPLLLFHTHTLLGHCGPVISAAASETLSLLLTASRDGSVRLWNVPQKSNTGAVEKSTPITAVAWAPDGSLAVSGSQAGELILWQEAKAVARTQAPGRVSALRWSSPQTFFALINDRNLCKWQVEKEGLMFNIFSLDFNLQLNELGRDNLISAMDLTADCCYLLLAQPLLGMLLMDLDATVSESWDGIFYTPHTLFSVHKEYGAFVLETQDNAAVSVFVQKETDMLYHIGSFNLQLENPQGNSLCITQAKPESDSAFLCASSEGVLWKMAERIPKGDWDTNNIWQTKDGYKERRLETQYSKKIHSGSVTALHVLPDLLVTASEDQDVKLWERSSLQLRGLFHCEGAVSCVEPRPGSLSTLQLAVGDAQGHVYFLSWE